MQIAVYLYSKKNTQEGSNLFPCVKCRRPMFRHSADRLMVTNSSVFNINNPDSYEPSAALIELRCHGCGTIHQILFQ